MSKESKRNLVIAVVIPLAVGVLSSLVSGSTGYAGFMKPSFAPPGWVFPVVWTVLYVLMGISSYLVFISRSYGKRSALEAYGVQLFFNFFWSIWFFRFSLYLLAFGWLLALIVLVGVMIVRFYRVNMLAAHLQVPYFLWCIFAAYLNFAIYRLN